MAYNPFLRKRLASGYGDYLNRTPGTGIWSDSQYPHGRMPDFEAYVMSYPKLLQAYKKKYGDDMSKLMPWGRQHWRKHGKEAGRDMQFQAAPKYDPSLFKGKKIASRHRRMVGAGDKTLKSGTVIPGYNP